MLVVYSWHLQRDSQRCLLRVNLLYLVQYLIQKINLPGKQDLKDYYWYRIFFSLLQHLVYIRQYYVDKMYISLYHNIFQLHFLGYLVPLCVSVYIYHINIVPFMHTPLVNIGSMSVHLFIHTYVQHFDFHTMT